MNKTNNSTGFTPWILFSLSIVAILIGIALMGLIDLDFLKGEVAFYALTLILSGGITGISSAIWLAFQKQKHLDEEKKRHKEAELDYLRRIVEAVEKNLKTD